MICYDFWLTLARPEHCSQNEITYIMFLLLFNLCDGRRKAFLAAMIDRCVVWSNAVAANDRFPSSTDTSAVSFVIYNNELFQFW